MTNRRNVESGEDFYPTPAWATHGLLNVEPFMPESKIWEPACGDGAISKVLIARNHYNWKVVSTDLYDHGYGFPYVDFLTKRFLPFHPSVNSNIPWDPNEDVNNMNGRPDHIITNPPYCLAEAFLDRALSLCDRKVCLLLRTAFVAGSNRFRTIFQFNAPVRIWQFSERITFYPGGIQTGGSGTTEYAWYVWDNKDRGQVRSQLGWIPPGTREKYS